MSAVVIQDEELLVPLKDEKQAIVRSLQRGAMCIMSNEYVCH